MEPEMALATCRLGLVTLTFDLMTPNLSSTLSSGNAYLKPFSSYRVNKVENASHTTILYLNSEFTHMGLGQIIKKIYNLKVGLKMKNPERYYFIPR